MASNVDELERKWREVVNKWGYLLHNYASKEDKREMQITYYSVLRGETELTEYPLARSRLAELVLAWFEDLQRRLMWLLDKDKDRRHEARMLAENLIGITKYVVAKYAGSNATICHHRRDEWGNWHDEVNLSDVPLFGCVLGPFDVNAGERLYIVPGAVVVIYTTGGETYCNEYRDEDAIKVVEKAVEGLDPRRQSLYMVPPVDPSVWASEPIQAALRLRCLR